MKNMYRIFSILLTLALLAGCAPAPTPAPTATVPPPPTATPTPEPTATATPTPVIAAIPGPDDPFPTSTISRMTLTTADMDAQKTAFTDLVASNENVKQEADIMIKLLKVIGGKDITTEGIVDQARWGVFAKSADGATLILQKTIDGGKTWVNVIDASAYSELVAPPTFDKNNYRFVPLNRPSGIPQNATVAVIAEQDWMVYVFLHPAGPTILAWYDAANDVFKTVQGEELKQEVSYIPYEAGQTWEQVQKNNVVHWPLDNPEQFEKELAAMHEYDIQLKPKVDLGTNPDGRQYVQTPGSPPGWLNIWVKTVSLSTLTSVPRATVAASLQNPNGDEMIVVMSQITVHLANGEYRTVSIPTVRNTNRILNGMIKYYGENSEQYNENTSANYIQRLTYYNSVIIMAFAAKNPPLTAPNLPKDYQMLAQLHDYNTTIGVTQAYERLIKGEGTEADITLLKEKGLIPVYEALFEVNRSYHVETTTP